MQTYVGNIFMNIFNSVYVCLYMCISMCMYARTLGVCMPARSCVSAHVYYNEFPFSFNTKL